MLQVRDYFFALKKIHPRVLSNERQTKICNERESYLYRRNIFFPKLFFIFFYSSYFIASNIYQERENGHSMTNSFFRTCQHQISVKGKKRCHKKNSSNKNVLTSHKKIVPKENFEQVSNSFCGFMRPSTWPNGQSIRLKI